MNRVNFTLMLKFGFGMFFECQPKKIEWHPFLFSDAMQYRRMFVYDIMEHSNLIVIGLIILMRPEITMAIKCFFILLVADMLEYWATGSEVWYFWHGFPVSFNTFQIIIFGIVCWYEELKNA